MKKPIILSFMLIKGGCGKTTISTNVAAEFAVSGRKVLFIDADPQGNATATLGPKDRKDPGDFTPCMADFLRDSSLAPDDVIVTEAIVPGIHLFPNNLSSAQLIHSMDPLAASGDVLFRLRPILPNYDYVIFDCPPEAKGLLSSIAIMCSDYIIAPVDGTYAASNLSALIDLIGSMKNWNRQVELLGVVLNHWLSNRVQSKFLKEHLRSQYPEAHIFNQTIPTSEVIKRAQATGRVIASVRGQNATLAFKKLAKEIQQTIMQREAVRQQINYDSLATDSEALLKSVTGIKLEELGPHKKTTGV